MPRKGGRNPKEKGARFERKCCNRLSLWVSDMTREDVFWRSTMSGGRATLHSRKDRMTKMTAQAGDIMAIHKSGNALLMHFLLECKHYAEIKLDHGFWSLKANFEDFWWKPLGQAHAIRRHPLVIVKQDRRPELVLTTDRGARLLLDCVQDVDLFPCVGILPLHGIHIFRFDDLLFSVDYKRLRRQLRRRVK